MIKLLLIDDEPDIREGIKNSVDWEQNGIQIIGEAANGKEALELINITFPDIIIVDIRMPEMNGLQLLESLSNSHPYIKSILLSGYEDFEYARKGIQFGACDYLTKPCRSQDLLNSVLKACQHIQTENLQKMTVQKYNEFLPYIKNKYLSTLVIKNNSNHSAFHKLNFAPPDISLNNLKILVLRLDSASSVAQNLNVHDTELINESIIHIVKETLENEYCCEVFEVNDDIVALININATEEISMSLIDIMKSKIKHNLNFTVSVGVSEHCGAIKDLPQFYEQALNALDFRFFFGEASTIMFHDIHNASKCCKTYPTDIEKQIMNCIKADDEAGIKSKLDLFYKSLSKIETNRSFIIKSSLALLFSVYNLCIESNVTGDEILQYIDSFDKANDTITIHQLKQNIADIIITSSKRINNNKINNQLIGEITKFIGAHYNENINLNTIAKAAYITPSYVSLLFKQVLGINFVDYLHKTRINKACALLMDPKLKSYEVAYMVGYNDDKYFIQIFKKYLGLTPTQYRENII